MRHLDSFFLLAAASGAHGLHHMKMKINSKATSSSSIPLVISNNCGETIYPGLITQAGTGPASSGFELTPGTNKSQTVSTNWQGRVWGRSNCTFSSQGKSNGGGKACGSGDCNGALSCSVTGDVPVTLAEFTLDGGDGQTYFDISLVDGYNLPMAIVLIPQGNSSLEDIPPNLTSPSCVGTASQLAAANYNPYTSSSQLFLGTNSSFPLPFDTKVTSSFAASWCPWDLQSTTPKIPGGGVYPYPDGNIQRPAFDPCLSACAKYNSDQYCCTGQYDGPKSCHTNYYSTAAKKVCPDAYSYAYDDQTSTFIIPSGAGFEIVFCPGGRSTNILKSKASQLSQLSASGTISSTGGSTATASSFANPTLDAREVCLRLVILLAVLMFLYG